MGLKRWEKTVIAVLAVLTAVGIAGHLIESLRPLMLSLTPFYLLASGGAVLASALVRSEQRTRLLLWTVFSYLFTFSLEAVGVATGRVFGAYEYGTVLGLLLFRVPLVIGFNWVLVVLGGIGLSSLFLKDDDAWTRLLFVPLTAAAVCVLTDIFMEPVAIRLGYWEWAAVNPPLQNYLAWGAIAFITAFSFGELKIKRTGLGVSVASLILMNALFTALLLFLR